jgi:hypothetical protein
MAAFAQDRPNVTVDDVKAAIEELQWIEYAERSMKLQALHGLPGSMNAGYGAASCSVASWSASMVRPSRSAS